MAAGTDIGGSAANFQRVGIASAGDNCQGICFDVTKAPDTVGVIAVGHNFAVSTQINNGVSLDIHAVCT